MASTGGWITPPELGSTYLSLLAGDINVTPHAIKRTAEVQKSTPKYPGRLFANHFTPIWISLLVLLCFSRRLFLIDLSDPWAMRPARYQGDIKAEGRLEGSIAEPGLPIVPENRYWRVLGSLVVSEYA